MGLTAERVHGPLILSMSTSPEMIKYTNRSWENKSVPAHLGRMTELVCLELYLVCKNWLKLYRGLCGFRDEGVWAMIKLFKLFNDPSDTVILHDYDVYEWTKTGIIFEPIGGVLHRDTARRK